MECGITGFYYHYGEIEGLIIGKPFNSAFFYIIGNTLSFYSCSPLVYPSNPQLEPELPRLKLDRQRSYSRSLGLRIFSGPVKVKIPSHPSSM